VTAAPIEHPTPPPKSAGLTPGSLRLGAVVLAIAAIVGALVSTRHGPDLGPDSVTYLSAARNLVHGRGFTDFTEEPLTVFAPGYPAILAIGHFVGAGAESVGRFANALLVGAIALVSLLQRRRRPRRRRARRRGPLRRAVADRLAGRRGRDRRARHLHLRG